jgi:hypothetical protein
MDVRGFVVLAVVAAVFLLFLRDVIASGVRRGILAAHEVLESEKVAGREGQPTT